ncbi:MAG: hypothetical protein R3E95_11635 [Thiolinea sp.]
MAEGINNAGSTNANMLPYAQLGDAATNASNTTANQTLLALGDQFKSLEQGTGGEGGGGPIGDGPTGDALTSLAFKLTGSIK